MKAADPVGDRRASFWSVPTEALFEELNASAGGLTQQEAQERLARYGLNRIKARRRTDSLTLFLAQFNSPIILILLVARSLPATGKRERRCYHHRDRFAKRHSRFLSKKRARPMRSKSCWRSFKCALPYCATEVNYRLS
jgi:hypothetical protein